MRVLGLLLAAAALAGCGTTERSGGVGETLEARTVSAKLIDTDRGRGVYAVEVGLCNQRGQAVISWHFQLRLADGTMLHPLRPQRSHHPEFSVVRDGCKRGWIEYLLPRGASPEALEYRYDDTGSGSYRNAGDSSEHDHFVWTF